MFRTKNEKTTRTTCRCVTEEMVLREGIQEAKTLHRGKSTVVGPLSTNSIQSMKWELPETKYSYSATPVNDAETLFEVTIRRHTWLEEHRAKKNPPQQHTCCFVCAAGEGDFDW